MNEDLRELVNYIFLFLFIGFAGYIFINLFFTEDISVVSNDFESLSFPSYEVLPFYAIQ